MASCSPDAAPAAEQGTLGTEHRPRATRLGVGLLAVAGAFAVAALATTAGNPDADTDVEAAIASVAPPTIPPHSSPPTNGPVDTDASAPAGPAPAATTLPLSPLAADLPDRESAVPTTRTVVAPVSLTIADLRLVVPVRDIGVQPDGQLEIPDETEVGWYRLGASPGNPGATVLAAHVSWNDTIGPFFRLGTLALGAPIVVDLADGSSRTYQVVERAQYSKLGLPPDRIWTREGDETLVLITCGGEFNRSIRRYQDNIVVYAVPVASTTTSG